MTNTPSPDDARRNELAREVWPLVRRKAVGAARRHPRIDPQEFESAAGAALAEAIDTHDPEAGVTFRQHVVTVVNRRLKDIVSHAYGVDNVTLRPVHGQMPVDADGVLVPLPDGRADDPAAIAVAADGFPDPNLVAAQAARLRATVVASVTPQDMAEIMQAVVKRAKAGHVPSATLVLAATTRG